MSDLRICLDMGMLIRAISHYSTYIFENIEINKRKYREHLSLKQINTKYTKDHPTLLLNTYCHLSLSSKSCTLGCLRFNVPGHGHVRQLRDVIEAQMKEERLVLCDVKFQLKKNSSIQQKLREEEKKRTSIFWLVFSLYSML
jgi:hypothetical protein